METVSAQEKLFAHTVKYRNCTNFDKEKVSVSAYLNVEVCTDQKCLLNPTTLDTVAGFLLKDSQGKGAKKRLPQRRLNFVDGQVSSHCSVLNSDARMKLIQLSNQVAAVMAGQRRITQLEKDKEAKEKGVASSKEMMLTLAEKRVAHLRSYTVAHLKDLI